MNRTKKLGTISLILVAVLVFTAVFNLAYTGIRFDGKTDIAGVATANSSIKKSDMNMDSIREKYLNFETVEKNTAAFDGERWVIVELDASSLYDEFKKSTRFTDFNEYLKSVEAQKALASLRAKQSRFLNKLDRYGVDYTFKYNYSTLSAGIAIKINASAYNTIAAMSEVKDVYYSESYAAPKFEAVENNANVYSTGIYNSELDLDGDGEPDDTYQGQGMAVAILDTGLDRTHEAFNPEKFMDRLNAAEGKLRYSREDIAKLLEDEEFKAEQFGAGVNDVYYNEKVPFAYDYSDDDPEVFPGYSNHGTHVAGIVAGQDDTYVVNEETGETFRGVAPLAQLVICKVFTDNLYSDTLGGANDIDIVAALDDCVKLGVDVINMSLGTSAGFADEKSQNHSTEVYNKIREIGISLVCAASNDYSSGFGGGNGTNLASNPDSGTVGSPSSYYSALSVASINGKKSKYLQGNNDQDQVAFITNSSDGDGNRIEFIEEIYKQLEEKYGQAAYDAGADLRGGKVFTKEFGKENLNLKYVLIGGVGRPNNYSSNIKNQLKSREAYNGEEIDGTVALVKRGDTTFEEKVQEAMSAGADAVIIYNNVSGTINMSLGEIDDPVPTCLITMDASAPFVDYAKSHNNIGTIQISSSFEAGPFMSDFSSWGPVSNLTLKPEITAHGGEITSAVPGAYDVLSGTSMASPNMAGAVAVLRQYLQETTSLEGNALNARVNQVLMSTATIAHNEEGNPYSPRKQGAGLAGIKDAVLSEGYITVKPYGKATSVYNEQNDSTKNCIVYGWLDKTKIELFDDPARTGKYELQFTVHNITDESQIYVPTTYVMTETLASDRRTVAEKAYMLNDMCDIVYSGAGYSNGQIIVPAQKSVDVKVEITLKQEAIDYFNQELTRTVIGTDGRPTSVKYKPFENGMYVEGFVSLDNVTYDNKDNKDGVTLGVPYLAFYGDWTASPLFDYDIYEVSEIEANSAIDFENKLKTTSLASQVIGMYHNDDYILPLGTYLYEMDEEEDDIYPARDKIALSQYDEEGSYTVYELYAAYAGLLRNASEVKTVVTNAKTGEVVYEEVLGNVGKAYAAGGGNRGAFVRYEINPSKWGWQNNDEFYFKVEGWLDYGNDGNPLDYTNDIDPAQSKAEDNEILTAWTGKRNTFEFPLTIDYEAPQITDYTIRFDSYKEYGVTKYRTYLDIDIYDNQYVMAVLPCFLKDETEGKLGTYLNLLTEYPIPVYGEKGATTKVAIDITDYYEKYGLKGELYIQVEDYAMNSEVYNITLDEESLTYPADKVTFVEDNKLELRGEGGVQIEDAEGNRVRYPFPIYDLTLNPFELYKLNVPASREKEFLLQNLTWKGASDLVLVQGDEIFALDYSESDTTLELVELVDESYEEIMSDSSPHRIYAQINVHVENGKKGKMPSPSSLNFRPVHAGDNHVVNLEGLASVEVNPNSNSSETDEPFKLEPYISPWYFEAAYEYENNKKFEFEWRSANEDIATVKGGTVQEDDVDVTVGFVTFIKRGNVNITCAAADKDNYRYLNKSVNFVVGEDYYVNNYYMYEWYGGKKVEIPTDVNVLYLDEDCFKNDTKIEEVILPPLLMEIPNFAFQNCTNLKKITIPSQCAYIGPHAFDGCTNLETVIFPEYVDANKDPVPGYYGSIAVGHYAFQNCVNLKNFVTGELGDDGELDLTKISHRMTVMYDGAFRGCTGLKSIDLSALRVAGTGVFAGCTGLESVKMSSSTAIGPHMFDGCKTLNNIRFEGSALPDYAFNGCEALKDFTFGEQTLLAIGDYALAGTGITNITLPAGDYPIGSGAFANSKLTEVTVADGAQLAFAGVNPFNGCKDVTFKGNAYKFENGALYNIAGDTLISAPSDDANYKLPATVTTIGDGALSGSAVTNIDLTNVKKIGKYAFAGSKLTAVTWPEGLDEIAEGAFSGCTALTTVNNTQHIKKIGARAFEGCTAMTELHLDAVTEVGDYAFYMESGDSAQASKLATLTAPELQTIGDYAFMGTAISEAQYNKTTSVGAWAFASNNKLKTASLGAVESMGDHAFYRTLGLTTVTFEEGTLEIGDYAFSTFDPLYDNVTVAKINALERMGITPSLKEYLLAYVRQSYMNITPSTKLVTVNLPKTVTKIGAYAFAGQAGLAKIELGEVTTIGDSAFRLCTALAGLDLSKAVNIGDYAFYGSSLTTVNLANAKQIGAYAFAGSKTTGAMFSDDKIFSNIFIVPRDFDFRMKRTISGGKIRTLTLGAAERIGDFAFAGNSIQTVTLPASMNKSTYTFEEIIYDEKGREERSRTRIGNTFGAGVFAYNASLDEIKVDDSNPAFTSIDGVLYAYKFDENGEKTGMLELVQYPTGKKNGLDRGVYTVVDNTVAIAESAFEGATRINGVIFPYTLKLIGSSAFYGVTIEEFYFNSVQAPTLVAANDDLANESFKGLFAANYIDQLGYFPWSRNPEDGEIRLDLDVLSITAMYSNFAEFAFWSGFGNSIWRFGDELRPDIKFIVPNNGIGYDSALYKAFVIEKNFTHTENNLPDDTSYNAINKIKELEDILNGVNLQNLTAEELDPNNAQSKIALAAKAAREAYNMVTNSEQQELIKQQYESLLKIEEELRKVRNDKGLKVTLKEVDTASYPTNMRYDKGASFNTEGMAIRVVYSDGSEFIIEAKDFQTSGVTIKTPIVETGNIVFEYKDALTGETREFTLLVNVNSSVGPSNPSGPSGSESGDPANVGGGLPTWAIAVIAVGAVLVAAAVAVTIILVLKKKGKGAKPGAEEAEPLTEETNAYDNSGAEETSFEENAEDTNFDDNADSDEE